MSRFHPLRVVKRTRETRSAVSWELLPPESVRDDYLWRAGQHLIIRCAIDGESHRRCYSISAPPGDPLRITVREKRGGRVSGFLHESLREGGEIEASPPAGRFVLRVAARGYRSHYFFAAGSGITPIFSMIRSVLDGEPLSRAYLLFGNRSRREVIFGSELERLSAEHGERFRIIHALTSSFWTSSNVWRGRIDAASIRRFIDTYRPIAQETQYWICGPGDMNPTVREALMALDVPAERIHAESFGGTSPGAESLDGMEAGQDAELSVMLPGKAPCSVPVLAGQTLLQALRVAEIDVPFSCTAGVCGTCIARLEGGKARMRATMGLDEVEIASGLVLTCQAVPITDRLAVRFET